MCFRVEPPESYMSENYIKQNISMRLVNSFSIKICNNSKEEHI